MATIQRPAKTGGNRTYAAEVAGGNTTIKAAEVDSDLSTIYDEFNGNVDNANVKAGAGIATSKLAADGGLTNAHINASAAIAGSKLAVGAAVNGFVSANVNVVSDSSGGEVTLVTLNITTRGGRVLLIPTFTPMISGDSGGVTVVTLRYKRDGVTQASIETVANTSALTFNAPWPVPPWSQAPAAGTYAYSITMQVTLGGDNGQVSTDATAPGVLQAIELS